VLDPQPEEAPDWKYESLDELIDAAFFDCGGVIDSVDHPVIKKRSNKCLKLSEFHFHLLQSFYFSWHLL
jgi:hypothetical protein